MGCVPTAVRTGFKTDKNEERSQGEVTFLFPLYGSVSTHPVTPFPTWHWWRPRTSEPCPCCNGPTSPDAERGRSHPFRFSGLDSRAGPGCARLCGPRGCLPTSGMPVCWEVDLPSLPRHLGTLSHRPLRSGHRCLSRAGSQCLVGPGLSAHLPGSSR